MKTHVGVVSGSFTAEGKPTSAVLLTVPRLLVLSYDSDGFVSV